jgi:hypothetical protein
MLVENPWLELNTENNRFLAKCDISYINNYVNNGKQKLKLDIIPHPYMGNPFTAVVYLLLGNPLFINDDYPYYRKEPDIFLENLRHKVNDYPLYWLNPIYRGSNSYNWWIEKLSFLDGETDREIVTNRIFSVEYYAYYSKEFPDLNHLPSQKYSFHLIEQAIRDEKIIIVARHKKLWYSAIPGLKDYVNKYELNSSQNVVISQDNIGQDNFNKIIKKLRYG